MKVNSGSGIHGSSLLPSPAISNLSQFWQSLNPCYEWYLLLQLSFKMASGEFFQILSTDTGPVKFNFEKSNAAFNAKKINSILYRILSLSQSEVASYYRILYSDSFPDLRFWLFISYVLSILKLISGKRNRKLTSVEDVIQRSFCNAESPRQDQL